MALEKIRPRVIDEAGNYTFNNVTATGNLVTLNANLGNIATANYIKTNNLQYANGVSWPIGGAVTASGSNTHVQFNNAGSLGSSANFVFDSSTNRLTVDNISGNGAALTNLTGANITGTIANANFAAYAGNITLSAQSNITSVGTLTTLTVTGNISTGNANLGNFVIANFFSGSGNNLSNIQASNVTGEVSYATTANSVAGANVSGQVTYAATANAVAGANVLGEVSYATTANSVAGANVSGQVSNALIAGTVYTNAQPNITSVGTLSSLSVTGNLTAGNANITGSLVANTIVTGSGTGNISGANYVIANYFSGDGSLLTGLPASYSNTNTAAYLPTYTGNLVSLTGAVTTTANITANYFIGNGSQLTGLPASYSNTNVAAYLPTYTGNYTGNNVVLTGNISTGSGTGNISGANYVIANYFSGDGSLLTGISGTYSNSNVANYLPTYTGNVSANYFIGNGATLTNITGANVTGNVTSAVQSHYANIAN